MKINRIVGTVALATTFGIGSAGVAQAGFMSYDIAFTGSTVNSQLPTGSFDYDPTAPTFANFTVKWGGLTFDLTSAANGPILSGATEPVCGASGAALSFLLLSRDSCLTTDPNQFSPQLWEIQFVSPSNVSFIFSGGGGFVDLFFNSPGVAYATTACSESVECGEGNWTISESVPAPATLALFGLGIAGLGSSRRKKA